MEIGNTCFRMPGDRLKPAAETRFRYGSDVANERQVANTPRSPANVAERVSSRAEEGPSLKRTETPQAGKRRTTRLGTIHDLARRWQVAPKTIRNWLSSGQLQLGIKVCGQLRFDIQEVIEYERQHCIANSKKSNADATRGGDE